MYSRFYSIGPALLNLSTLALVSKMFIGFGGNGKQKCGPKVLSMGTYLHMSNFESYCLAINGDIHYQDQPTNIVGRGRAQSKDYKQVISVRISEL